MNVLVSGATGYTGAHTLLELIEQDHRIDAASHFACEKSVNESVLQPLQLCFVGPNNLLVIKKGDNAVIVNKQPVKYIKQLAPSNARPKVNVNGALVTPKFVAKEFLLSPGEHSNHLLEFYCHKYWVVLSGTAWITLMNVTQMVKQQHGLLIPPMQEHRIYNKTTEPLRFVEVCTSESLSGKEQIQFIDNASVFAKF